MAKHGKLIFKLYEEKYRNALILFCQECSLLGYKNNASLEAMKIEKAYFFIGLDNEKIVTVAGIQKLPEVNDHAWRCLFRGAQLPGYTPSYSMNIFKSGIHFSQLLYLQIKLALSIDIESEFYISTNINPETGAKSSRLNNIMMPRIAKIGIWNLHQENVMLYGVLQNLWKINVEKYMEDREHWLSDESYKD